MGLQRSLSDADGRARPPAGTCVAHGLQRGALHGPCGLPLADDAQRPAPLVDGLPASAARDRGRELCSDGARSAQALADAGRPRRTADGRALRWTHFAEYARERGTCRRRWRQAQEGIEGAYGRRHPWPFTRAEGDSRQRAGASPSGRPHPGKSSGSPAAMSKSPFSTKDTPEKSLPPKPLRKECVSAWSNSKKPSAVSSCCPGAGSSKVPLPGPVASADWLATTSVCPPQSPDSTGSRF